MKIRRYLGAARAVSAFALARGIQLVTVLVVARLFAKEEVGVVLYLLGFLALSQAICSLGLEYYAQYHVPRVLRRGRRAALWSYLATFLAVAFPASLLIGLFLFTFPGFGGTAWPWLSVVAVAGASALAALRRVFRTILLALGRRAASIWHDTLSFNLVFLAGIVVVGSAQFAAVAGLMLCSSLAAMLIALPDVRSAIGRPGEGQGLAVSPRRTRILLAVSMPAFVSQVVPIILNRSDVLLLAPLSSAAEVAVYSVAVRLTFVLSVFLELESMLYGPQLLSTPSMTRSQLVALLRKVMGQAALVAAVTGLPMVLFAREVVTLVFGPAFVSAAVVFQVLLAGKLLTAPFQPVQVVFTARGFNRPLSRVLIAGAATTLVSSLILIPPLGALGAAIAATVTLLVLAAGYALVLRAVIRAA